ncbi:MAG: hypothetical protein ACFFCI_25715, partial [Promethearchaeota archaeon]
VMFVFLTILTIGSLFSFFTGNEINFKLNSFTLKGDYNFTIGYDIEMQYNDYFKIPVPTIHIYSLLENKSYELSFNYFTAEVPLYPVDYFENVNFSTIQSSSKIETDYPFTNDPAFYKAIGDITNIYGRSLSLVGLVLMLTTRSHKWLSYLAIFGSFV